MKLAFTLLLCLGTSLAVPKPPSGAKLPAIKPTTLGDDLQEIFIDHIDLLQFIAVILEHLETDGAFSASLYYLQSEPFQTFADEVLNKPAIQEFLAFLLGKGLDALAALDTLNQLILTAVAGVAPDMGSSLVPFIDEIIASIDVEGLVATVQDKLENSPDFQDLWVEISSEDAHAVLDEIIQEDEAKYIGDQLRILGVDVDPIIVGIWNAFGWGAPPLG